MAFRKQGNGRFGGRAVSRPRRDDRASESRGAYRGRPSGFGRDAGHSFERSDRPQRSTLELFDAVCASCGKATQVPFKPNGIKPVYCRDCFQKSDTPRRGREDSSEPSGASSAIAEQLAELNEKLDKILRAMNLD